MELISNTRLSRYLRRDWNRDGSTGVGAAAAAAASPSNDHNLAERCRNARVCSASRREVTTVVFFSARCPCISAAYTVVWRISVRHVRVLC